MKPFKLRFAAFINNTSLDNSRPLTQAEVDTLKKYWVIDQNDPDNIEYDYTSNGSQEGEITLTFSGASEPFAVLKLNSIFDLSQISSVIYGEFYPKPSPVVQTFTMYTDFDETINVQMINGRLAECCEWEKPREGENLLCFRTYFKEFTLPDGEDCIKRLEMLAEVRAELAFEHYLDSIKHITSNKYLAHCKAALQENLVLGYHDMTHHWTLYYYNRAGNLVQTVPPAGTSHLEVNSSQKNQLKNNLKNADPEFYLSPAHSLTTQYSYNSLNQIAVQYTPDGDTSMFFYDRAGRLAASQNANQRAKGNVYSYTIYDKHGRIIEAGEADAANTISQISLIQSSSYYDTWLSSSYRRQITKTFYDLPKNETIDELFGENGQTHLRGRVATVAFYPYDSTGYRHATHYSYDIHGNVHTLIQDYPHLEAINQRYKYINYFYDLVSGNVNLVIYQHKQPDQFMHFYRYDADNRITQVLTSRDSIIWDRDAAYQYYKHGPLARTELGQHNVQGIDYTYTIHGWLKGVNSNSLNPEHDIGKDGSSADPLGFTRDAFGFSLGYFGGDYIPIESGASDFLASTTNSPLSDPDHFLYNGNIGHMVTSIKAFMGDGKPQAALYKYDQLNRLAFMQTTRNFDVNNNSWENASLTTDYMTFYEYDANGNILRLQRNATEQWGQREMDDLEYFYYPGTNRLEYVTDAVHDTMYYAAKTGIEDIDNQQAGNYQYDRTGNLVKDRAEGIDTILWNVYGKVSKVLRETQSDAPDLWFDYDAMGQRVRKTVSRGGFEFNRQYTYYARDAQGNVMATYKRNSEISGGHDSVISAITGWILEHDSLGIDSLIKLMQNNFRDDANFKGLYIDELSFESLLMETIAKNINLIGYFNLDSMLALAVMNHYPLDETLMENLFNEIYIGFKTPLLVDPLMNCGSIVSFLEMLLTHDGSSAEFLNGLANISVPLIESLHLHIFSMLPPPGPNRTQTMIDNLMDFGLPPKHSELDLAIAIDMLISTTDIEDVLQNSISASLYWDAMNPFHPFLPAYHFKNGYLVDLVNCADPEDVRDFWNDFINDSQANYDLVEDILFGQTNLTYLLYLMSLHHPDMFIELSLQEAYSMLSNVLIALEEFSFEDYLALIKNQFGANYAVEVYNEILKDFIYTERYILENLYLYGSNRLGMITPNQTIYERVFTISGIDNEGNYIIDEVLEADSAVVQDTIAQRILTKKQYELSNHLGNVLVTVSDRRNPVESQSTSGEIAYYQADIASAQDYYPFGMIMPGRYGGDTASYSICDTSYYDSVITKYSEDFSSGTGNWSTGSVPFSVQWDSANERMELEGDDDGSYAYLQFSPGNFESGVEYELTMDVELDNSGQNILIDVLEGTTSLISFYTVPYENGNYHPVEIQFTPTSSTSVIEIRIYRMGATNTEIIYVDNVLITYKVSVVDTVLCEENGYELAGGYRFGFNTQERDDEIYGLGNSYTAEYWQYDSRLGRRWNIDPITFPWQSPFTVFNNNPIYFVDPLGLQGQPPKDPKHGDTWTLNDNDGSTWNYEYDEELGWIGTGGTVVMPETIIPSRRFSGSLEYPEQKRTIVKPPVELPVWAKRLKDVAYLLKMLPVSGDIHTLYQLSKNNNLSSHKNPASYIPLPGSSALNNIALNLIVNDVVNNIEDAMFYAKLNQLNNMTSYNRFANEVNMHNGGLGSADGRIIIIIYTDNDVSKGEMFYSINGLNPTNYARYIEDFEAGFEYNGWKPKYAIFGIKSEYNGFMFPVRGKVELNYE